MELSACFRPATQKVLCFVGQPGFRATGNAVSHQTVFGFWYRRPAFQNLSPNINFNSRLSSMPRHRRKTGDNLG
jgi:hypothetical protein